MLKVIQVDRWDSPLTLGVRSLQAVDQPRYGEDTGTKTA
jgi:hypothetical protein